MATSLGIVVWFGLGVLFVPLVWARYVAWHVHRCPERHRMGKTARFAATTAAISILMGPLGLIQAIVTIRGLGWRFDPRPARRPTLYHNHI